MALWFTEMRTNYIYQPGDNFMNFLLFVLATVGLSHIIVHGSIFQPIKQWLSDKGYKRILDMTNCYQCSGFWSGFLVSIIMFILGSLPTGFGFLFHAVVYGFAGSFVSDAAGTILDWLKFYPGVNIPQQEEVNEE